MCFATQAGHPPYLQRTLCLVVLHHYVMCFRIYMPFVANQKNRYAYTVTYCALWFSTIAQNDVWHCSREKDTKWFWCLIRCRIRLTTSAIPFVGSVAAIPATIARLRCIDTQSDTALERVRWTVWVGWNLKNTRIGCILQTKKRSRKDQPPLWGFHAVSAR